MINEVDYDILRAFLRREADQFKWKPDGDEAMRKQSFKDRMFDAIVSAFPDKKIDYVRIQSMTNMGLLSAELVLTAKNWGAGETAFVLLPPSPNGGGNIFLRKTQP